MSDLWSNPLFGLALSILAYLFGLLIFSEISSSLDNSFADCSSFGYCFFEINRYFLQGLLCRRLLFKQPNCAIYGCFWGFALQDFFI